MATAVTLQLNGRTARPQAPCDTPLLDVLRNEFDQHGPRFGCGLAQCGACTVHVDGRATRSCATPSTVANGRKVTSLDGLPAHWRQQQRITHTTVLHPVQQAFVDEQAAQCGRGINGWIMTAVALLEARPDASDTELREGLSGLKCRCGTQVSVLRAAKGAARQMRDATVRAKVRAWTRLRWTAAASLLAAPGCWSASRRPSPKSWTWPSRR